MQKPILIDLDGVLRLGSKPAKDINLFLSYLTENQIPACILSNSSLYTSDIISKFFESYSIQLTIPIITAIDTAYYYISEKYKKVAVYTSENVISKFADFLDYENPEAVLIGDIGNLWNYKLMQTIFEYVNNGAEIVAVHKNRFWQKNAPGLQLDAGPFIVGLEYATGTSAKVIGKPSPIYFNTALKKIGYPNQPFIMIGDDLESDIAGAKKLEAITILILTGKTNPPLSEESLKFTDHVVENLTETVKLLETL